MHWSCTIHDQRGPSAGLTLSAKFAHAMSLVLQLMAGGSMSKKQHLVPLSDRARQSIIHHSMGFDPLGPSFARGTLQCAFAYYHGIRTELSFLT